MQEVTGSAAGNPAQGQSISAAYAREVEKRSIDWIPHSERRGAVRDLGSLWFVSNLSLTTLTIGFSAVALGTNLLWSILAIISGSLFGTFFMAFHSAQGPQLGLPQLVQSRPQFGYLGAALTVWIFALINYVVCNVSDAILVSQASSLLLGIPAEVGYLIAGSVAALMAYFGYSQIHYVSKLLVIPTCIAMAILTIGAVCRGGFPPGSFSFSGFRVAPFMSIFVMTAGFQLGWGPYVSDYSRYLPSHVSVRATFFWTYIPSAFSAIWVFVIGAAAAVPDQKLKPVAAFIAAGDGLYPGFGTLCTCLLLGSVLSVMAINAYGGSLTMISMADSFFNIRPTKALRAFTILVMTLIVWSLSRIIGSERIEAFLVNSMAFLAYLFTPWTAVNLVDYFFVRKGIYVIREIFKKDGIYGHWGWRGNLAYCLGFVTMIPFFATTPYTGFLATRLGGFDGSIFVGLSVACAMYWLLSRSIDLQRERDLATAEGNLSIRR